MKYTPRINLIFYVVILNINYTIYGKVKIIEEENISFEELYLFCTCKDQLNSFSIYEYLTQNKKLESMLLEKFSRVEFEKDLMGGAIMVAAYK